jgi:succinyl-CoA synthetase beta subunit
LKLLEYQAKDIFRNYGIMTPREQLAEDPLQAVKIGEDLGFPLVVKAQVPVGGRGKAGGVKLARNREELEKATEKIFGLNIKGCIVDKVLISEAIPYEGEYYLSFTLDRSRRLPLIISSPAGGIDIEEISRTEPEKIEKVDYDFILGVKDYDLRRLFNKVFMGVSNKSSLFTDFSELIKKLISIYFNEDATLVEINPLVISNNRFVALDAKLLIDDNALFLHPKAQSMRDKIGDETLQEKMARELGLTYVSLDGDIACIVNGAGLAMATMDLVKYWGGEPANFLDIGGSSNPEKTLNAFKIILTNNKIKAILVNIFGGITRCDDIAKGLLEAIKSLNINMPLSVRLIGTNDEAAKELLQNAGMSVFSSMDDAIKDVVKKSKEV